jgi:hypothetical protein
VSAPASVVQRVTTAIVAGVRAQGSVPPAGEQAIAQLQLMAHQVDAAANATAWDARLDDWVAALQVLGAALGQSQQQLFVSAIARRLPPIPGFAALPLPADPTTVVSGLQKSVSLGPVEVGVSLPSAIERFEFDPNVTQSIGVLPPTGASLAVNAGVIHGNGALDFQESPLRLAGSFGVKLGTIDVFAFGILERTDASFALLLLLGARFVPAIELSFGFSIGGVGGLIGINRRADSDALRARLASGAVVDALFPANPTQSAPAILGTLGAIFPAAAGSFVVGPTLQLAWLKIGAAAFAQVDLGLFIELPGPSRIVLIGRAQAELPGTGSAILHLRLDLLGIVDFQQKIVSFDASLVGSHVLQTFRIAGDAAFRYHWGPGPYSVLTVGGFYPGFNPAPAVLPPLRRASIALNPGISVGLTLRAEAYFAVTTSSFQLGGRIEALMGIGKVGLAGWIQLDAIVQFAPFSFHLEGTLGFAVRVGSRSFGEMDVHLVVDGPGPVVVRASVEIDVLFFDISVSHTFRLGSGAGPPARQSDLRAALVEELGRLTNLRAENGDDPHVVQAPGPVTDMALLSPVGRLIWSQARAPLGTPIQKVDGIPFGSTTVGAGGPPVPVSRTATVTGVSQKDQTYEWFSPGAFRARTNSQALAQSSYEEQLSGVVLGFEQARPDGDDHAIEFEERYRTDPPNQFAPQIGASILIPSILDRAVEGRTSAPRIDDRSALVTVQREQWVTHNGAVSSPATSETAAHAIAKPAQDGLSAVVAAPEIDVVSLGVI